MSVYFWILRPDELRNTGSIPGSGKGLVHGVWTGSGTHPASFFKCTTLSCPGGKTMLR